jgi:phosphatidylglycerophosphatase C
MVHARGANGHAERPVVLFDLDGVLVKGDSFALFMRCEGAVGWRRAAGLGGLLAAAPLTLFPALRSRAIRLVVRAALVGISADELHRRTAAFGAALAKDPRRVLRDGVTQVREHLAAGDRVIVVTASEEKLARAFLDTLGLDGVELVASRLRPAVHNRGEAKVRQLAARGVGAPWQVAYSDSLTDLPMLRGARRAVLVNASPRTLSRARAALGERVVPVAWQ